jgi:hypothetical protein
MITAFKKHLYPIIMFVMTIIIVIASGVAAIFGSQADLWKNIYWGTEKVTNHVTIWLDTDTDVDAPIGVYWNSDWADNETASRNNNIPEVSDDGAVFVELSQIGTFWEVNEIYNNGQSVLVRCDEVGSGTYQYVCEMWMIRT